MVSDSKITYDDHPPSHGNKLESPFYHIVMGGAGSTDLYNEFKINVLYAAQPNVKIPETFLLEQPPIIVTQPVQTSGVIHMFSGPYNFFTLQSNFGNIVKGINKSKYATDINRSLEVLVATQIGDTKTPILIHMTKYGQSDVNDYRAIGSSEMYSYVFLKPMYQYERNISMYKFAKISYVVVRFIERFDMDQDVGGQPQFWCIPNSGDLFNDYRSLLAFCINVIDCSGLEPIFYLPHLVS